MLNENKTSVLVILAKSVYTRPEILIQIYSKGGIRSICEKTWRGV